MTTRNNAKQRHETDNRDFERRFRLEEFFLGHVKAWGVLQDRRGKLKRRFIVDIDGAWDGQVLRLDEQFRFSDGSVERRVWHITKQGETSYQGRAEDVVGVAKGKVQGETFSWAYRLKLKIGNRRIAVDLDDWMFAQDGEVVINRARMKKFGLKLGDLTIVFRREEGRTPSTMAAE